jgi:hypothetical protein
MMFDDVQCLPGVMSSQDRVTALLAHLAGHGTHFSFIIHD